jgi:hypothetical protein
LSERLTKLTALRRSGAIILHRHAIDRSQTSRLLSLLLATAWLVSVAALVTWLSATPMDVIRQQLKSLQFWSLDVCVVIGVALGLAVMRDLVRSLNQSDAIGMIALATLAFVLTVFVAPRTNRIYYDEQIYQSIGQNLSDLRLAQMCNEGNVEYGRLQCFSGEYNKQPYAFPHLLSLAYRAFGVHAATAFIINALVMMVTACSVYLLVLVWFGDRVAAFFAGLLISLTPQQVIWSATAAVEPSASLACVVAVLCAGHFSRSQDTAALAATGVASAYATQFRPESLLILPVIVLMLWGSRREFNRMRFWWVALLILFLLAVHIAHMFAVRNEGWGTTDVRLSMRYVWANLQANGGFYLGDWRFPLALTLLALLGITDESLQRQRMSIGVWFFMFFGIFLLFYAGSYNYGADVRYSLMTYPPIAVLGGLGAARVAGWLHRIWAARRSQAVLTAAIVFQFLWYAPLVRATTEEAWAARADVRFAESLVPELRGNSYVLTQNPGMFHVWGINAGQMSRIVMEPRYLDFLAGRYSGGVYLHWNFWCNVQDAVQQEFCQKALATQPFRAPTQQFQLVREYRERDQRFAIYRLVVRSGGE